jgi:hypothetical protein
VCRPSPKDKCSLDVEIAWYLPVTVSPSPSRSFEKRKPSNSLGLGKVLPSVWAAFEGMETSVPAGMVMPLENVNGRSARRLIATGMGR